MVLQLGTMGLGVVQVLCRVKQEVGVTGLKFSGVGYARLVVLKEIAQTRTSILLLFFLEKMCSCSGCLMSQNTVLVTHMCH